MTKTVASRPPTASPSQNSSAVPELAELRDRLEDRYNAREARLVARRPARIFATVVALGVLITAALLALVSYESSGPPAPPPTTVPLAQIPNFPTDFDCDAKPVDIVSVPPHTDAELIGTCRLTDGSRLTYAIFPTRDLAEIWAQQQRASAATPGEQVLVGGRLGRRVGRPAQPGGRRPLRRRAVTGSDGSSAPR